MEGDDGHVGGCGDAVMSGNGHGAMAGGAADGGLPRSRQILGESGVVLVGVSVEVSVSRHADHGVADEEGQDWVVTAHQQVDPRHRCRSGQGELREWGNHILSHLISNVPVVGECLGDVDGGQTIRGSIPSPSDTFSVFISYGFEQSKLMPKK